MKIVSGKLMIRSIWENVFRGLHLKRTSYWEGLFDSPVMKGASQNAKVIPLPLPFARAVTVKWERLSLDLWHVNHMACQFTYGSKVP